MTDRYILGTLQQSLIYSGIILYARGVATSSKHRKQYDIQGRLSDDQKDAHQELCGLRDDAVPHYGPGKLYKGEWVRETVIMHILTSGEGKTAGIARRITLDPHLIERAIGQSRLALSIVEAEFQLVSAGVALEVIRLTREDRDFREIVVASEIDLAKYLGSVEAAEAATDAYKTGTASGIIAPK